MTKKIRKSFCVLVALSALFVCNMAFAFDWTDDGTGSTITRIAAGDTSDNAVIIAGLEDVYTCGSASIKFIAANSNVDDIYTMVMAAFLSGKNITCRVNGCLGIYQKGEMCKILQ